MGPDRVEVDIPYWRNDITIEDDLVEEVVRIIGYDSVPVTMLSTPIPYQQPDSKRRLVDAVKDGLAASGMQEVINYPVINADDLVKVEWAEQLGQTLRLANPLNATEDCLRPTLRPSLLETLAANQGHGDGPFRLFEVGRVFRPQASELPEEREMVAGILAGQRWAPSWLESRGPLDFYDAKGVVEGLLERLGVLAEYEPAPHPFFSAGRCALITAGGNELGTVGEVNTSVVENFDLRHQPIAYFGASNRPAVAIAALFKPELLPDVPLPRSYQGPCLGAPSRCCSCQGSRYHYPAPVGGACGVV